ncbi:protease HtpX [Rhabdochlamydiaceae symbiont of Dictyostelium giganteum]|uniref:protease HtpX n=1 Tax=Rhabdochlamydiaceae symbiont of Dictyostelium giganteum TaxID=3342349 RepID=UPI00384D6E49
MAFIKRIVLFFAVNTLVVISISIILNLLQVRPYLQAHGIDYKSLMIFCAVWGSSGAFISLALSRIMAKWMMGVKVIDQYTANPKHQELLRTVEKLSRAAHLMDTPEVGIYDSYEVNAFATGPTRKRSLVAVSTGLLNQMSQQELEGVLGHEIAHIINGDMVTMTLVQGVINAFVMFFARILAFALSGMLNQNSKSKSSRPSPHMYAFFVMVFELIFMFLGMMIIAAYSRFREFRADQEGSLIAGKDAMIGALKALKRVINQRDPRAEKPAFDAMKIASPKPSTFQKLFSTHPSLDTRIERLESRLF